MKVGKAAATDLLPSGKWKELRHCVEPWLTQFLNSARVQGRTGMKWLEKHHQSPDIQAERGRFWVLTAPRDQTEAGSMIDFTKGYVGIEWHMKDYLAFTKDCWVNVGVDLYRSSNYTMWWIPNLHYAQYPLITSLSIAINPLSYQLWIWSGLSHNEGLRKTTRLERLREMVFIFQNCST